MVCSRCKSIVIAELDRSGIKYDNVELGEVTIARKLTVKQHDSLFSALKKSGFELISDYQKNVIEKLKRTISEMQTTQKLNISIADFICHSVNFSYATLNKLFSEIEGITIEKYIIQQKIEFVKKLLSSDNLNIHEIASIMNYNSVAQMSGQFKTITGLTPSHFIKSRHSDI